MTNSLVYLAACQSGKDSTLANAFLNKGASAVVANSETILTLYNLTMQYATIYNMCSIKTNTANYHTLSEALSAAKAEYGQNDSRYGGIGATPLIFGGSQANNYRFGDALSGTLSGKIVKASDRTTPITTATINVMKDNNTISFQPDSNGSYSRELSVDTHYVKVVADSYIEFNAYADIEEDQTVYMETFLMVEGEEGQVGEASGTITNALTGIGIEGVKLDVRSGWNNDSVGNILTTVTTNASGSYIVNLPIGNYTLSASKDGFVSTTINIVVQPNMCTSKNGSMTPNISGDNYRVVLTWGANPRDLDSHVVGTLSSGSSFHVYYSHKSQYDGAIEVCNLDYDDTTSYGPETITLNATTSKPYYYIYRYAGSGTENIYSVELPVDTETIVIHGENEEHQIASTEISLADIQENNCIVSLACKDDVNEFEIMWGIYDPETEEVTFEVEMNLVIIEENAEEITSTEETESLGDATTEETEGEDATVSDDVENPENTDAVS